MKKIIHNTIFEEFNYSKPKITKKIEELEWVAGLIFIIKYIKYEHDKLTLILLV